ncbi:hypothetical protein HUJ05_001377 [Dendroctonus ponderosae]|nr:hypothetical protein HUJ05_001377 [Dendroctonus ponderosae]
MLKRTLHYPKGIYLVTKQHLQDIQKVFIIITVQLQVGNHPEEVSVNPYITLLLSQYGRYLPIHALGTKGLYHYAAANNYHNNKPFGLPDIDRGGSRPISAGCYRPTLTSYIYIVMGCYMPFFSVPTEESMAAATGAYMKLLVVVSTLTSSLAISTYFVLYFSSDPAFDFDYCSSLEIIIRTIGVIPFTDLPMKDVINWCLPEPLMLVTSLMLLMAFKRLTKGNQGGETQQALEELNLLEAKSRRKVLNMISYFGKYLVCLLFCLTSILKPNVFGAVYYITFLVALSLWANNQSLEKGFARIIACSIPVLFINMTILFLYQFQYFQDRHIFQSVIGRLFSLVPLKTYENCKDPRLFKFHTSSTATYMMPVSIFILYCSTILVSRDILQAKVNRENQTISIESGLLMDQIKLIIDHILQFVFSISHLAANFMMMI